MKADSTHTKRCFEQIRDDLFRMVLCEEDAASQNDRV